MGWKTIGDHIPRSAKIIPVWVKIGTKNDLVYLTDDEKYFVSIDRKRVYLVNKDVLWNMVDMPE